MSPRFSNIDVNVRMGPPPSLGGQICIQAMVGAIRLTSWEIAGAFNVARWVVRKLKGEI